MESRKLKITYYRAKDYLYLVILPPRPAVLEETGFEFYIHYDAHDPDKVVGFEWLGFSEHFPALDEQGVIPRLSLRFAIEGTTLANFTLKEVLHWAYKRYVLRQPAAAQPAAARPHYAPALAAREKPEAEYET